MSLTVPEFDFPRSDLPANVRYAGILTPRHVGDWVRPDWWGDLDGDRPVVVVTQGTVANRDLGELVEPTLTALADRDVLVIAATGRELGAVRVPVPANAREISFVPFAELLPRCDLLVTNGGFGATQQALAAGVPVIVAGETEDKPMIAARVAHHRLGVDLQTSTPTPVQLARAVEEVLADPVARTNVQRIAAVYAAHDARAEIAALVGPDPRA